jgi:predicted metalloprotease
LAAALTLLVAPACSATSKPKEYHPTGSHPFEKTIAEPTRRSPQDEPQAHQIYASLKLHRCSRSNPLKGCQQSDMEEYVEGAMHLVWDDYYAKVTSAHPPQYHQYIPPNPKGFTYTSCADIGGTLVHFTPTFFGYCPADKTVYIGEDRLWSLYQAGPLAPMVAIAHEYGHRLQAAEEANVTATIKPPKNWSKLSDKEKVNYLEPWFEKMERQADCAGGAWLRYAQLHMDIGATSKVIDQIVSWLIAADKAAAKKPRNPNNPDKHLSGTERRADFLKGYNSPTGIKGCNSYFERPIVP